MCSYVGLMWLTDSSTPFLQCGKAWWTTQMMSKNSFPSFSTCLNFSSTPMVTDSLITLLGDVDVRIARRKVTVYVHTSDNQLWTTLVRNDITQVAIVTFFVENKTLWNLIILLWLIGQRTVSTSVQLTCQCMGCLATDVVSLGVLRRWLSEVRSVKLLGSDKSDTVSAATDQLTVKSMTMAIRA